MGWKSRQEKELRRLIELSRPVSTVRENVGEGTRSYNIAATIHKIRGRYQLLLDVYYPTGTTGETIREEGKAFDDLEQVLRYLKEEFDISFHEFKA